MGAKTFRRRGSAGFRRQRTLRTSGQLIALGALAVAVAVVLHIVSTDGPAPPGDERIEQARSSTNHVRLENDRPGTAAWDVPPAPAGSIEGYASATSVLPGTSLGLHVSTAPEARYRVDVYRLGWYGGTGARLMDCGEPCAVTRRGEAQAVRPTSPDLLRAGWPVSVEVGIKPSWVSGYYVAKLVLTDGPDQGKASSVPFIVRAPPGRTSTILVQAAVNTWQAYNNWGGKSLYDFNSTERTSAKRVSFDRPSYERVLNGPFSWEYPLVRFLEREGYDVAYTTDVDSHRQPAELQKHRLVMTAGHGEYWTKEMRDGFESALAAGTNLMFMGANTAHWQMRYEDTERTIVEYRSASLDPEPDPARKTVLFRDLEPPRPECQLLGVQYQNGLAAQGDASRAYRPTAAASGDSWFANTGLTTSSVLEDLVGYEWDAVDPGCQTPLLTVLFHYEGLPSDADAVRYTAPSGARVFSSGTLQFAWGLDDWGHPGHASPGLQQFMRNAVGDFTSK